MAGPDIVLVDDVPAPAGAAAQVLRWAGYGEGPGVTSVPRYLERHGERLRATYLAFVHDLGEAVIGGRPLRQHFETGDGYSLWWMNRVAEKSPFKSARIFDCLKLLALEALLIERRPSSLTLHSTDAALGRSVSALCGALGIVFAAGGRASQGAAVGSGRWYDALPHVVQGAVSFRHLVLRWPFRRLRPVNWFAGPRAIFACSYFFHLDADARARGVFRPGQWGPLPAWLHANGGRANWLHHYLPGLNDTAPSLAALDAFNRDAYAQGHHAFLETYLSPRAVWRAVRLWIATMSASRRLQTVSEAFRPKGSAAWFWPLLEDDWRASMSGTASVSNCVWYVLFDEALRDVPAQPRGVFLFEGQGWETAFVHAWRKHGHGEVIAVPHSSMPFWYLNIYDDPRCLPADGPCRKPLADRWALNGPMAWRALTAAGYPEERLVPVEALRYQYLIPIAARAARARAARGGAAVRLLVLGDYTREQTLRMLAQLEAAAARLDRPIDITVKLHPACRIDPADVPGLRGTFTSRPLGEIIDGFDVAFASNTTSAGLDALVAGLPIVVFLDDAVFNHSPLRGADHVTFAGSAEDLADALRASSDAGPAPAASTFFWLDDALPRWRALLLPAVEAHV